MSFRDASKFHLTECTKAFVNRNICGTGARESSSFLFFAQSSPNTSDSTKEDDPELTLIFNALESAGPERLWNTPRKILRSSPEIASTFKDEFLLEQGQLNAAIQALPFEARPCRPQKIETDTQYIRSDSEAENQTPKPTIAEPVKQVANKKIDNPTWLVNGRT